MNSQFYVAASGLLVEERRVEMIANNLANLSTSGYRSQRSFSAIFEALDPGASPELAAVNRAVALGGAYEAPGPGPSRPTGRGLDVALPEGALFAVETPAGRRYTRNGALGVSESGELIDSGGRRVLGSGEQPIGGLTQAATITADGQIFDGDQARGELLVVSDPEQVLRPEGNNLLTAAGDDDRLKPVATKQLDPGWLEGSAANPISELVLLVEAQRAFESYQRIVSMTMNDVNRKAVTEIAG